MFCMSHFWVIDESSDECVRANEGVYEGTKGKIGGKYLVYQKYFFLLSIFDLIIEVFDSRLSFVSI